MYLINNIVFIIVSEAKCVSNSLVDGVSDELNKQIIYATTGIQPFKLTRPHFLSVYSQVDLENADCVGVVFSSSMFVLLIRGCREYIA